MQEFNTDYGPLFEFLAALKHALLNGLSTPHEVERDLSLTWQDPRTGGYGFDKDLVRAAVDADWGVQLDYMLGKFDTSF